MDNDLSVKSYIKFNYDKIDKNIVDKYHLELVTFSSVEDTSNLSEGTIQFYYESKTKSIIFNKYYILLDKEDKVVDVVEKKTFESTYSFLKNGK
jgi:hypothetical protein